MGGQVLECDTRTLAELAPGPLLELDVVRLPPDESLPDYRNGSWPDISVPFSRDARAVPMQVGIDRPPEHVLQWCAEKGDPDDAYHLRRRTVDFAVAASAAREQRLIALVVAESGTNKYEPHACIGSRPGAGVRADASSKRTTKGKMQSGCLTDTDLMCRVRLLQKKMLITS